MTQNIEGFLTWLKENDIGVGLCHLHQSDSANELTRDEWLTLIDEYLTDMIEGFDGT
jgi:hypothetical protein